MNARTQLFRNSFIPSCISSWNNIPEHIRDSDTLAIFKRQLSNHLCKPIEFNSNSCKPCFTRYVMESITRKKDLWTFADREAPDKLVQSDQVLHCLL